MAVGVGSSTALTPLQRNFAGIKRAVADYVQGADQASILDKAGEAINSGIDVLNMYDFQWMVKTASNITTVADDRDYTSLPSNWKKPHTLFRLDSSDNEVGTLTFVPPHDFSHRWTANAASGVPTEYTVINAVDSLELLLSCKPGSAWVTSYPKLKPRYYSRIIHFVSDSDTIGGLKAPPEAWTFIKWYGRWDLAAVRGDNRSVERAFGMWNRLLAQLRQNDNNDQTDY